MGRRRRRRRGRRGGRAGRGRRGGGDLSRSAEAYDRAERVASYDAGMDVMHPNRHVMVAKALRLLPFSPRDSFTALDLGSGTGFFTGAILEAFPGSRVIAVDGAPSMVELARERLGPEAARVDFRIGDFRELDDLLAPEEAGRLVTSSYALHHLSAVEKARVLRRCVRFLEPGGWLLNADIVVSGSPDLEARLQELRIDGILERSDGSDPRFASREAVVSHLAELEAEDGDQPLTLPEDLDLLARTGLASSGVFWLDGREALTGGRR